MADEEKLSRRKISTDTVYETRKTHTKYEHIVRGRTTLKYVERFRNGSVHEPYEISLYERTFMREPFIEKHAISTELSNVNREKHRCKSHRVCRPDREPSRIPIRSLKRLRNNTGGPSSSSEMIILRNNGHDGIIRVCMGIFTSALRNKKIRQILKKNTSPRFHSVVLVI